MKKKVIKPVRKEDILKYVPIAFGIISEHVGGDLPTYVGLTKEEAFRACVWGMMDALSRPKQKEFETLEKWVESRIYQALQDFCDQLYLPLEVHDYEKAMDRESKKPVLAPGVLVYGDYWLEFRLSLSIRQLALCDEICHEYRDKIPDRIM